MQIEKTIYALGVFDGVHLGHQALLDACRKLAKTNGCKAGAVTFTVHPDGLVSGKAPALLNTIEDRKALLHAYGMDTVVALSFDKALMTTHWSDFLTQLIEQGAAGFVCGDDFRFGAGGNGTAKKLAAFCESHQLPYAVAPQQELDGVRVSSTHIRSLLAQGDVAQTGRFLGHPHVLSGQVVPGRGLGHTIDIPTANLLLPEDLVIPKLGVYACKAVVEGKEYLAVTNIGSRPTVGGHQVRAESWLLDFEGDLYGKQLMLTFHKFLRPEKKFSNLEELREEILKNAAQTRKLLGKS
jgi:riboflavin kinase/FMN adenylyltransferase